MNVDEFQQFASEEVIRFRTDWARKVREGNANYPEHLELEDWIEQFNAFLEDRLEDYKEGGI